MLLSKTSSRKNITLLFALLIGCYSFILNQGCSSTPPTKPPVSGTTVHTQKELGSILGPITKAKVLDRLKAYPVCGIQTEAQKETLRIDIIPLGVDPKTDAKKPPVNQTSLLAIECFFFGIQGLYEYALITPQDGRVYPLSFQGAEPVKGKLNGSEKMSPVAKNEGRSEVCGVPKFDPKTKRLQTLCKGDVGGSCGAFAVYTLASQGKEQFEAKSAYFELESAHFQSCAQPKPGSPSDWPTVSLP